MHILGISDRSLLQEHDALLAQQLGIFYMHYHIDMMTHGTTFLHKSEALDGQVDNMLVEYEFPKKP